MSAPGQDTARLAANLGLARPPLIYLSAILAGWLLDAVFPLALLGRLRGIGAPLIALAVVLFISALRLFRAAGTSVRGNEPTTAIVRTGPYRFSRNPIYLSFSLLHLGIALWTDNPWMLATLVPAVAVMAWIVIPREERYLEERFGTAYLDYKRSTRRWL